MKKLMALLGVAAMAASVHAAAFSWTTSEKAYSIAAATINAGLANGNYGVGSANADTMSNQISSFAATWAYEMTLTDTTASSTKVLTGSLGSSDFSSRKLAVDITDDFMVAGHDYTYSIVLSGTLTDGKSKEAALVSNAIVGNFHANDMGDIGLDTAGPSSWTATVAVPEPTSGLLLILGVAGLALRRRRA